MAKQITQAELLNEILPALNAISQLIYPSSIPISFHMTVAENINLIKPIQKVFGEVREKLLVDLAEKDKDGKPKVIKDDLGKPAYELSYENRMEWDKKFKELNEQKVKINLKQIDKKHLEGVEGINGKILKGLMPILKK